MNTGHLLPRVFSLAWAHQLHSTGWPVNSRVCPVPAYTPPPRCWGFIVMRDQAWLLLVGAGDQNAGPDTYAAGALPTGLSPLAPWFSLADKEKPLSSTDFRYRKQLATAGCVGHAVTTSGHSCLGYFEGLVHNQKDGSGLQDKPRPWEPWWALLLSRVESFLWENTRVNGLVTQGHRVSSRQHWAGTTSA